VLLDAFAMGHVDGDESPQLVVVGQVDQAEAAASQNALDAVAADVDGRSRIGRR
jgi:hypothetical protein